MRRLLFPWIFVSLLPVSAAGQNSTADYTAPHERQALEIFEAIVGVRSAEGHGRVPEVARYLADQFRQAGFPEEDIHILPFTKPNGEESVGLVVRYVGDGSSGKDPILFLGHMDVVDALPEDWERDPFTLIEEDGYLFGRGTMDNKMGVAMLTTTFIRLRAEGFVPTRDLVIAFTGDEETDMISARRMVNEHRALTDAEFALNSDGGGGAMDAEGNPVGFYVQASEKTYATFELTVTNPGGHSSTPRDDNAIYDLATALKNIQAYRFPVMTNEATRRFLTETAKAVPGPVGEAMAALAAEPSNEAAAEVLWHEPELVGITRTTCVATMLRGGPAPVRDGHGELQDLPRGRGGRRAAHVGGGGRGLESSHRRPGRAEGQYCVTPAPRRHGCGDPGDPPALPEHSCHPPDGALRYGRQRGQGRRNPHIRGRRDVHALHRSVRPRPQRTRRSAQLLRGAGLLADPDDHPRGTPRHLGKHCTSLVRLS
ncbi:MAG: M20/M25/M40 family metallo-hydrolase [Gemmatimonadota bacterium]|nr:M20/M25/M40 family metallo-hydrolase [Gemmatimonadota bacterium]